MMFLRKLYRDTKIVFLAVLAIFCLLPVVAFADVAGQTKEFFVDSGYDLQGRATISALLHKITDEAYFYLETEWYDNLTEGEKDKAINNIEALAEEFSQVIYPVLTENYGEEWNPGVDSNKHITILFQKMPNEIAGYFKSHDETSPLQNDESNEREMVYLNSSYLLEDIIKSYLSHEFTHLITFNQKQRIFRQEEEVWLNELRAEYAPVLLGYDDSYPGSNLEKRINIFLDYPSDSLTEWTNKQSDYGVIVAFANYLVDHYGEEIVTESLQNSQVGIGAIQEALQNNYIDKEFWEIFYDWVVAVFLNDCREDDKYCYKNENLTYIKITPSLIFLPPNQMAELTLVNDTTYWTGNWYRIIGGADNLQVAFDGDSNVEFKVPYVLCKASYDCSVRSLELNTEQNATLVFDDFLDTYSSLTLMPFVVSKTSGFNGKEERFDFSIRAKAVPNNPESIRQELIAALKAQIAEIQQQIAVLQAELVKMIDREDSCILTQDLYIGVRSQQVECLQRFFAEQGVEIYPEGFVTGYFGQLTKQASMRFQAKYAKEVLYPIGITAPTGYIGVFTRAQINKFQSQ